MGLTDICTNYLIFQKHLTLLFGPIFFEDFRSQECLYSFPQWKRYKTCWEQTAKIIEQQNSGKLFSTLTIQKIGAFIKANFKSSLWIIINLIAIVNSHFDCKKRLRAEINVSSLVKNWENIYQKIVILSWLNYIS